VIRISGKGVIRISGTRREWASSVGAYRPLIPPRLQANLRWKIRRCNDPACCLAATLHRDGFTRIPEFSEGPEAAKKFDDALSRIVKVSKDELAKREAKYQKAEGRKKPRK
jgi:hypothetical protein